MRLSRLGRSPPPGDILTTPTSLAGPEAQSGDHPPGPGAFASEGRGWAAGSSFRSPELGTRKRPRQSGVSFWGVYLCASFLCKVFPRSFSSTQTRAVGQSTNGPVLPVPVVRGTEKPRGTEKSIDAFCPVGVFSTSCQLKPCPLDLNLLKSSPCEGGTWSSCWCHAIICHPLTS